MGERPYRFGRRLPVANIRIVEHLANVGDLDRRAVRQAKHQDRVSVPEVPDDAREALRRSPIQMEIEERAERAGVVMFQVEDL
jgi:hypothetical protein